MPIGKYGTGKTIVSTEIDRIVGQDSNGNRAARVILDSSSSLSTSSVGGGNNSYSNASGDFTATPNAGTKTITLTGLSYTLTNEQLQGSSIKIDCENIDLCGATTAANVITVPSLVNNLTGSEVVTISLLGPDKAYDPTLDTNKITSLNPDYAYRTSPELVADLTNQAAGTTYYVMPWDTYQPGSLMVLGTTGAGDTITYTIWATNKFDADLTTIDETEWSDVTSDLTTSASHTIASGTATAVPVMHFFDTKIVAENLLLKVVVAGGTTNTFEAYLKKAY